MEQNEKPLKKMGNDIVDILWAGILWLLCSLPIVTIGASSCALYYTVVKVVRRRRETVAKAFFYSFRQNLRQGIAITILYGVWVGMLIIIFRGYYYGIVSFLNGYTATVLLVLMGLPFLLTIGYIIPVISRFSLKLHQQIQLALTLSIRNLHITIYLIFLLALAAMVLFNFTFLVFIIPGFVALVTSMPMERVLVAYMKKQKDKLGDIDEEAWYMEE